MREANLSCNTARASSADDDNGAQLELDFLADDPELEEAVVEEMAAARRECPATRRAAAQMGDAMSIYAKLQEFGLLRKVTDIVMAKVAIPWHLRQDATQEVHVTWAALKAKPHFEKNQVARYAYISGQHAALKLRRTIGAVVAIPGALFRTGRDTAFMEAIGAAVNPKDVDDYRDSLELSVEPVDVLSLARVSENFFRDRLAGLTLSPKQRTVAFKALVERKSAEDIAEELDIPLMYVERLLNQVTAKLLEKDRRPANCQGTPAASRAPRKPRKPNPTRRLAREAAAPRVRAKRGSTT